MKISPLPDEIVYDMICKLTDDPRLLWRMLTGTAYRLCELMELRIEDVVIVSPTARIHPKNVV